MDRKSRAVAGASVPAGGARHLVLIIPLVLLLTIASGGVVLWNQAEQRRDQERTAAEARVRSLLRQARDYGAEYVSARQAERAEAQARLQALANAVASDVQARLQTAIADREARLARRDQLMAELRAERAEREKKRLAAQRELDLQEMVRYKELFLRMVSEKTGTAAEGGDIGDEKAPPAEVLLPGVDKGKIEILTLAPKTKASGPSPEPEAEPEAEPDTAEGGWLAEEPAPELPEVDEGSDWPERLLAGCRRDLSTLIKTRCVLTIANENGRSLLRLGADEPQAAVMKATTARTFLFHMETYSRQWSLEVVAFDERVAPEPTPTEYAERLCERLDVAAQPTLRGVLYDATGEPLLFFPEGAPSVEQLPLPEALGAWARVGRPEAPRATRLDSLPSLKPCTYNVGLQIALADPSTSTRVWRMLATDQRWAGLLVGAVILGLSGIAWGLRRRRAPALEPEGKSGRKEGVRLVRKEGGRSVPEDARVLVAEISEGGGPQAAAATSAAGSRRRGRPLSLKRLQAVHRGSQMASSARILDHARSPILRQLVANVRPRQAGRNAGEAAAAEGKPTGKTSDGKEPPARSIAEAKETFARLRARREQQG